MVKAVDVVALSCSTAAKQEPEAQTSTRWQQNMFLHDGPARLLISPSFIRTQIWINLMINVY